MTDALLVTQDKETPRISPTSSSNLPSVDVSNIKHLPAWILCSRERYHSITILCLPLVSQPDVFYVVWNIRTRRLQLITINLPPIKQYSKYSNHLHGCQNKSNDHGRCADPTPEPSSSLASLPFSILATSFQWLSLSERGD